MELVILHYHLNRGGVTSVVENHLRSLALLSAEDRPERVAIVYGGRAAAWNHDVADELPFQCSLMAVPELEYDHLGTSSRPLYDALQAVLTRFDRDATILHIHNHSLGKKADVAPAVCRLAEERWHCLLQVHDFAEDLRPDNYRLVLSGADSSEAAQRRLYPQAAHLHYAVLNQRDREILHEAGVSDERLHLLPNPVRIPHELPGEQQVDDARRELTRALQLPTDHRFVLYPVRPIRRKNLGEFLLWSLLAENTTFALTLSPLNPQEQVSYQEWVDFATELQLPIEFEVANRTGVPFELVYAAADAIVTTSVAEGFGLVYLEASLARRPLVGRNLPGVCSDFIAAGMQFPGLSETMAIPSDSIDVNEVKQSHARRIEQLRQAYGMTPLGTADIAAEEELFAGDTIDFGRLESGQQQRFLRQLKTDATLRSTMQRLNPSVQTLEENGDGQFESIFTSNREVIAANYSPEVIGRQLAEIYRQALASTPNSVECEPAIARAILDRFVHPSQLFPIRLQS